MPTVVVRRFLNFKQAEGGDSECLLKPVFISPDPHGINGYLVRCARSSNAERHPS